MCHQRGQASVEFVALVLLVGLALAGLAATAPAVDGRSFGGFLAHHVACAAARTCVPAERELVDAYGERDAATVRALAPNLVYEPGERQLPVDWRRCRRPECARAPDERSLDAHRTDSGVRATAFTRVVRRDGRAYVQYWLYYPDSNTALAGSDRAWERSWLLPRLRELLEGTPDYPGFHEDDWESVQFRLDPDGSAWVRVSSHGHYQSCKWRSCRGRWGRPTGWVRVSRGSHSNHVPYRDPPGGGERVPLVPGRNLDERTTTGEGLRLIPLETDERGGYLPRDERVQPPWRKDAYREPESEES